MVRSFWSSIALLVCVVSSAISLDGQEAASVRSVRVLGNRNPVEIEIEGSERLIPTARVLTGPDRLVVDFAQAVPGARLRNQALNRGEVKGVRVSLLSAKPAVTRIVFDLKAPQAYQMFPSGRTVIIKMGGDRNAQPATFVPSSGAKLVTTNYSVQSVQITPPEPPPLVVSFRSGMLTITANRASLSDVLYAVHQRTGADIAIPAGAELEKVMGQIGPAPAPVVLAHLLNGSKFNFLILNSASDPNVLDRVILSARPEGPAPAYRPQPTARVEEDPDSEMATRTAPPPVITPPASMPNTGAESQAPPPTPEAKPANESPE
jgi:hypothetical protein